MNMPKIKTRNSNEYGDVQAVKVTKLASLASRSAGRLSRNFTKMPTSHGWSIKMSTISAMMLSNPSRNI